MSTDVATEKITVKELAREMRVHPTTIYRAIRAGVLEALRVGVGQGTLRITREARAAYREFCRANASTHTRVASGAPEPGRDTATNPKEYATSNSDKKVAVAREGQQHMTRLADRLGDLGGDARRSAEQYGELADRDKTR